MKKLLEDKNFVIYKEKYLYTIQSKRKLIINNQFHEGNNVSMFININDVIRLNLLNLPQDIKRKILDKIYIQELRKYQRL